MGKFLRGDIVWCVLDPTMGHEQQGRRPVLIISADVFNERSGTIIGLPITSQPQKAPFPLTYQLDENLLNKPSWVKISQIRVLSTQRLSDKITRLDTPSLQKIINGLNFIVDPVD